MLVHGAVVVLLIVTNFQTTPAIPAPVPTNTPPGEVRLGHMSSSHTCYTVRTLCTLAYYHTALVIIPCPSLSSSRWRRGRKLKYYYEQTSQLVWKTVMQLFRKCLKHSGRCCTFKNSWNSYNQHKQTGCEPTGLEVISLIRVSEYNLV